MNLFTILSLVLLAHSPAASGAEMYKSEWFTPENGFTSGIEGPSVDSAGSLYAMNLSKNGTVGKISPDGTSAEIFVELPTGSQGNGSRIDSSGRMYIADYKKHNVLVIEKGQREAKIFFHSDEFNQPNDLALSKTGTLFASDPNWKQKTGQIWRVTSDGKGEIAKSTRAMGTTNGIDLSPDEKRLYVVESIKREVWAYEVSPSSSELKNARMVIRFPDFSADGLRVDIDGNLYIARIEKGTIVQVSPQGEVLREISLKGSEPSNLAFGGEDGKTIYVTQNKGRRIETFRVGRPGREWCMLHSNAKICSDISSK